MPQPAVYVGIDVAQTTLVVAVRPEDRSWTVAHDAAGVATLQRQLQRRAPALIVLEATGGLERLGASTLGTAGLPVALAKSRTWHGLTTAPDNSPRPMPSTPRCWRTSRPRSGPRPHSQTPRPRSWRRY